MPGARGGAGSQLTGDCAERADASLSQPIPLQDEHGASTFAVPTAYGDLSAALLAVVALFRARTGNAAAKPTTWLFNIIGLTDLTCATHSSFHDHIDPIYLGPSYYLASINLSVMTVGHIVLFACLLRTRTGSPAANAVTTSVSRRSA